jgi:hypothetical protein
MNASTPLLLTLFRRAMARIAAAQKPKTLRPINGSGKCLADPHVSLISVPFFYFAGYLY